MRGLLIALLVCAPSIASAGGIELKGWTADGNAVIAVSQGMNPWSVAWAQPTDGSDFTAVCTPQALVGAQEDGGDAGCTICTDDTCAIASPAGDAATKSPDKKVKIKDKRGCVKNAEADGGKDCTRTIGFGKKGSFTYGEAWMGDKAPMHVFFRPDSGAALVTFDASGRMDGVMWSTMYVVDLGGGGVDAAILCGIVSGEDVQVVPSKKKPMLDDVVKCAVRQTSGAAGTAKLTTSWTSKDGGGKKVTHQGAAHSADVAVGTDAELDLSPAVGDGVTPDFTPCVDFQIDASIEGKGGVVWTKTIKVAQKCKKSKGKLACSYPDPDSGKPIDELKKQYRMPAEAVVTCRLTGLDLADGVGEAWIDAHSSQQHTQVKASLDTDTLVFTMNAGTDFGECDATDLDVVVVDDKNIPWFTKTVRVTEACPD